MWQWLLGFFGAGLFAQLDGFGVLGIDIEDQLQLLLGIGAATVEVGAGRFFQVVVDVGGQDAVVFALGQRAVVRALRHVAVGSHRGVVVGAGGAAEALEMELGLLLALGLLELQPRLVTGCVAELAEGQDLLRLFLGLLPALRAEGRIDFPADLGRPLAETAARPETSSSFGYAAA